LIITPITCLENLKSALRYEVEKLKVDNAGIDIMKKCYLDIRLTLENKDKDIALLKEAMLGMQLLRNPEKLAEISQAAKPTIHR
jgi:hypothetical protein